MRKIKQIALAIASSLLTLIFLEICMRTSLIADYVLPYAHKRRSVWPEGNYDRYSSVKWGDKSFRSFHLNAELDRNALRIVTLGDSCTWGVKIRDTTSIWPYVLEGKLREMNINAKVFNLSHRGDTTMNELEYLLKYGSEIQPHIVIVQYLINDPLPSAGNFTRVGFEWTKEKVPPIAVHPKLHKIANENSYLYSFLNERWENAARKIFRLRDLDHFDIHSDGFIHWENTKMAIRMMAEICRNNKIELVFIIYPLMPRSGMLDETYPFRELHQKIKHVVEENGIHFIDLLPVLAERNDNARHWWVHSTDGHPSEEAHYIIGCELKEFISRNLLPRGRNRRAVE